MGENWIGLDGWPCTFSQSPVGTELMQAITGLPGADAFDQNDIEHKARLIWTQAELARQDSQNCNLPASQSATDKELEKLHALCGKLADHIEGMHAPAISALASEGCLAMPLAEKLRKMMDGVRYAYGIRNGQEVRGRRPEIEASHVSEIAGLMYQDVTGRRPTCTTDPLTAEVRGVWPEFLRGVFAALDIKASVAAQARATSDKMRAGMTN